jgi:hypothetical protein
VADDARRALLRALVDYAGLFPPAQLGMDEAVAGYREARSGPHAWMLDRFVCPAARLDELTAHGAEESWPVTVTADVSDAETALTYGGPLHVTAVELRLPADAGAETIASLGDSERAVFVELPLGDSTAELLDALGGGGHAAKVRCGGTAPAPEPSALASFIAGCAARDLAWKATAGLHHPFRDTDPETGLPRHGFLNVLAAAGLAAQGADEADVEAVLAEEDTGAFALDEAGLRWRGREIGAEARRRFDGYGSCSFDEPVDDLLALGALEPAEVRHA